MKFKFENLGYVDEGDIELSDLTLICGPNNAGKTYISYSIYGFIKHFKSLIDFSLSSEQISVLRDEGTLFLDLTVYSENINKHIESASGKFSHTLGDYFNAPDDMFEDSKVEFSTDDFSLDLDGEFKQTAKFGRSETLIFDKAPNEHILSIALKVEGTNKLPTRILNDVVSDTIANCIFSTSLPKPFVVTSERTGISLFYKELDVSKNAIIEHLTESDKLDPITLLNSMRSRYARPIQDNISTIRDYENLSKRKSFLRTNKGEYKPVLDALQDLLGGSFKAVDKQVVYLPKKERNRDKVSVPVYIASSSIKSLFLIDLYVNYLAEKNGILIIDEPELNLHPDNQRKMASLLARLVNSGIKVMITTHSDYLIREINNRIMLSNDFDNKKSIMKSSRIIDQDLLNPSQVKAFSLNGDHSIKEVEVDKYGINMEIFDGIIDETNSLADDIYFSIEE
jgi:energy-coupling factor transporter ATP-binding protein EcfA2